MPALLTQKVVSTLPAPLAPSTIYFVRAGTGFDIYVTNNSGTIVAYPLNAGRAIVKVADQVKTANVALAADTELKVQLGVGQWRVRIVAAFSTANATMDFKFATNFTGAATAKWFRRRFSIAGSVAGTANENTLAGTGQIAATAVAGTTTGIGYVEIDMTIVVTVAGSFEFQWAQNTSDAGALTCLAGSTLEVFAA